MRGDRAEKELVLGLDSSTTGVKILAVNRNGQTVAETRESLSLSSPAEGYYEQDSGEWRDAVREALKKITKTVDESLIRGLAVCNQRETFVPLDGKGEPVRPAILWLDERCRPEVDPFAGKIGEENIHNITGKPVDYAPVVYRLAWMKNHEPELYSRTSLFCDVHGYLVKYLTGMRKTSTASACPTGCLDIKTKKWSPEILAALHLSEGHFPVPYPPGTVLGAITEKASRETGLPAGTPVIAGGGDGQSAGLGVNALSSERAYLNLGTAVVAGIYGKDCLISKAFRTMVSCSGRGYYYECSLRAGTFTLDWFAGKILGISTAEQSDLFPLLEREAEAVPSGCGGLLHLPYLCGVMNPWWDKEASGAFIGLRSFHTRAHMYRSVLEGIAFEQRLAVEETERASGKDVGELAVIGGGAKSRLWLRILADITGKKILLPENTEASCLGAAINAAVGAGWYKTCEEAASSMTRIREITEPDPQNCSFYEESYNLYKKLYPALKGIR